VSFGSRSANSFGEANNLTVDEETKAEFEEMSKKSPMAAQGPANAMQNFDLAGFLAGSSKQSGADSGQTSSGAKAKK